MKILPNNLIEITTTKPTTLILQLEKIAGVANSPNPEYHYLMYDKDPFTDIFYRIYPDDAKILETLLKNTVPSKLSILDPNTQIILGPIDLQ